MSTSSASAARPFSLWSPSSPESSPAEPRKRRKGRPISRSWLAPNAFLGEKSARSTSSASRPCCPPLRSGHFKNARVRDGVILLNPGPHRLKELIYGRKIDRQLVLQYLFDRNALTNSKPWKVLPFLRVVVRTESVSGVEWRDHAIDLTAAGGVVDLDLAVVGAIENNGRLGPAFIHLIDLFI